MIKTESGGYRLTIDVAFATVQDMSLVFQVIEQANCAILGISKLKPYTRDAIYCAIRVKDIMHNITFSGIAKGEAEPEDTLSDESDASQDSPSQEEDVVSVEEDSGEDQENDE